MIYCQFQMLIIDYSLDMFRASFMPIIRRKDHVLLHMEYICWQCWMWQFAVLWCYVEGVSTVTAAVEQQPSQCSHPTATFTVITSYSNLHCAHTLNIAPQYRKPPHPALPENTLHMQ